MSRKTYADKYTPEERKAWRERAARYLEDVAGEIVTDPDRLTEWAVRWQSGFHNYSLCNTLLILAQRPDATLCASYKAWKALGRHVKEGEHGLMVFVPIKGRRVVEDDGEDKVVEWLRGFTTGKTFDVSQTEGADFKLDIPLRAYAADMDVLWAATEQYAAEVHDIVTDDRVNTIGGHTNGKNGKVYNAQDRPVAIHALVHECAHNVLDHSNRRETTTRGQRETEAEATAMVACRMLGMTVEGGGEYLGSWHADVDYIKAEGARILKAAVTIADAVSAVIDEARGEPHRLKITDMVR